jgi:glycine/D-amino acid oxidase-like deaminating enzyme/nitrite reductase/ring-hydroxylating ferredoxin subunit
MNAIGEKSASLWMGTAKVRQAPALQTDARADVVVVGAGMAGLSAAYELSAGKSVIVLDRGELAGGMSSRTTAHLNTSIDDLYSELIRKRGETEAQLYCKARIAALDRIEEIQRSEKIDCDFRRLDGYLFPATADDVSTLEEEIEACHRAGLTGVEWVDSAPIPGARTGRSLRFPRQARFHPRRYLDGLIRCIERNGGKLFAGTPVVGVTEEAGEARIQTKGGSVVRAGAAVIATNSPINDWIAIHTKQAPYRTYVIAGRVKRGSAPDALYWDTLDPYHYVRLQPGDETHDWLIVGGEDHKTAQADDAEERLQKLQTWAKPLFPGLGKIEYTWSGQILEPVDYLPYSGRNPGNETIFVHTGDSGEGLNNALIGSMLLKDLIVGRENALAEALDPGRVTLKAAGGFVSENLTVAGNLAEYVTAGDVSSVKELRRGQGAIIRQGAKKLAAYRDNQGKLHVRSAVCTHAGCILHWNAFETCWDCTCHGSHFSVDGEPLNAPAFKPLPETEA